jgi:hypothetical protein
VAFDDMTEQLVRDRAAREGANRRYQALHDLTVLLISDDPSRAPLAEGLAGLRRLAQPAVGDILTIDDAPTRAAGRDPARPGALRVRRGRRRGGAGAPRPSSPPRSSST